MKTAVIYARYSSEKQTEQSIEGQIRECTEYAKYNDIVILDKYIDRATTGTNDNRASFQKMLKDCSKQAWDIVLVYKLDRFSRNKYEMAMHRKTLRDNGIKLVSAKENIPDSPEGIILESLLEGMAEYYSAELSQKVLRGMRETRIKGNFTGGTLIYGYKVENKKILVDENKAPVVKRIFEEYASGKFVKDIIGDLTKDGFLHRGKPFAKSTLSSMLRNKKYIGIFEHKDEVYYNCYPAIVPQDLFDVVNKTIDGNRYGSHPKEIVYLLKNKVKCGLCGNIVSSDTGTSKSGKVMRYYKCSNRKVHNKCSMKTIRKDILEEIVLNTTLKIFEDKEMINDLAEKILEANHIKSHDNTNLTLLETEKIQINKSLSNLLSAIENGLVTSTTKTRLLELEERLKIIEKTIFDEQNKQPITLKKEDILKFFNKTIKKEPLLLIKYLVKEVKLFNDKVEIYYNYNSNKKRPDEEDHQAFLFYEEILDICTGYVNFVNRENHLKIIVNLFI
ncbi:MAG: recombinase family protein [Clostridia bacterium]|nr:recombinase family protein [Clostridia bacterium]